MDLPVPQDTDNEPKTDPAATPPEVPKREMNADEVELGFATTFSSYANIAALHQFWVFLHLLNFGRSEDDSLTSEQTNTTPAITALWTAYLGEIQIDDAGEVKAVTEVRFTEILHQSFAAHGWKSGNVYSAEKKESPLLFPRSQLSRDQSASINVLHAFVFSVHTGMLAVLSKLEEVA